MSLHTIELIILDFILAFIITKIYTKTLKTEKTNEKDAKSSIIILTIRLKWYFKIYFRFSKKNVYVNL